MSRVLKSARREFVVQAKPATKLSPAVGSSKLVAVSAAPNTPQHLWPASRLALPQPPKFTAVEEPLKHSEYRERATRPTTSAPMAGNLTINDSVKRREHPEPAPRVVPSASRQYATVKAGSRYSAYRPRASRPSNA